MALKIGNTIQLRISDEMRDRLAKEANALQPETTSSLLRIVLSAGLANLDGIPEEIKRAAFQEGALRGYRQIRNMADKILSEVFAGETQGE